MANTTIQCIKLKEPITTTSERWRMQVYQAFPPNGQYFTAKPYSLYQVVPMIRKSTPTVEGERR
jgi:hypothetical protein